MKHVTMTSLAVLLLATQARAQPAPAPAAAPAPSEADKKKAEEAAELQRDRAKMDATHKAELARLTPEVRAATQAMASRSYPSAKAAVTAAMAGKHRKPGNADRDKYRHPVETLTFLGLKPNMTVIELSPGEGWYTELLAPTLAAKGKLLVTNGDANGPVDKRSTYYAQRTKLFLDRLPEAYSEVEVIPVDDKAPDLHHDGQVDMVLLFRELHGMVNGKRLEPWLAAIHKALKPGGVLGIEQHRAKADAAPEKSSESGYLPQAYVIQKIEAAGFKLAGKSEVNANPKDTTDYPEGVWTLPPSFALGDKDRAKYAAIGESDRMTLKFVKVAPKAAKPAAAPKK
jgi:predicted methyltransferase